MTAFDSQVTGWGVLGWGDLEDTGQGEHSMRQGARGAGARMWTGAHQVEEV